MGRQGDYWRRVPPSPHLLVSFSCLSAADEGYDFDAVAVVQDRGSVLGAGDDFEIHFDGDVWLGYSQVT
jgi:hypothetical protein